MGQVSFVTIETFDFTNSVFFYLQVVRFSGGVLGSPLSGADGGALPSVSLAVPISREQRLTPLAAVARCTPIVLRNTLGAVAPELRHYIMYVEALQFYSGAAAWALGTYSAFSAFEPIS